MSIDITKFHQTFFEESLEGLDQMEAGLLEMEDGPGDGEAINTIFRAAHSIKGGAGTLGFTAVAEFTHLVETLLDRSRSGTFGMTHEAVDVLLGSVDCLRDMLAAAGDGTELDTGRVAGIEGALQRLLEAGGDSSATAPAPTPDDATSAISSAGVAGTGEAEVAWHVTFAPHADMFTTGNDPVRILGELEELAHPGTYRVEADRSALPGLDQLDVETCYLRWTVDFHGPADRGRVAEIFEWVEDEADITIEQTPVERTSPDTPGGTDTQDPTESAPPPTVERRSGTDRRQGDHQGAASTSIRVDIEKIDALINMVGELVITQSMLQEAAAQGDIDPAKLREGLEDLERNTRELQGSVMQIRMLPISFSFNRLPRLVRDIAAKLGKTVELQIHGESTELDKTVMEKIGDPLVHLVRNALDHGLESPEVRRANGKPESGTVTLSAFHEGGNIVIEISDDGAGLDTDRILATAHDRGLVGDDEQLTEKQIHDLIFHPGFSTADTISDISGRGVGMDVVRRNITDLGGVIEVHSQRGRGSTFRIRLPLTLAILDGQVVRVGEQVFIVPLVSIIESIQFDPELTGTVAQGATVYRHRGSPIPLVNLAESFGTAPTGPSARPLIVIVEAEGTHAGLLVDDLLAQQQIVIKSLKSNFRAVPGLSGATILGDGTVALIIDVNSVLSLFRQAAPSGEWAA